jgi:hypothetical protein
MMRTRTSARDRVAVGALEAAQGMCCLCELPSSALVVVERSGKQVAVCLNDRRCKARIRRQVAGEAR